jgi:hypothetical protein
MTRKVTIKLLEMLEEGVIQPDTVIMACLKYMSEDEVANMAHINGFLDDEDDDDEVDEYHRWDVEGDQT